jgi:hypothetical protein
MDQSKWPIGSTQKQKKQTNKQTKDLYDESHLIKLIYVT